MKDTMKQRKKRCPVCEKEYPNADNYCGDDGSVLEQAQVASAQTSSPSAGTPLTEEGVDTEANRVLQL